MTARWLFIAVVAATLDPGRCGVIVERAGQPLELATPPSSDSRHGNPSLRQPRRHPGRPSLSRHPEGADRRAAVCFIGQFPRHGQLHRPLGQIFGNATYDAFITASTQHTENNASDLVDGGALCEHIRSVGGARHCSTSLVPYDGREYLRATKNIGEPFQMKNGLYPHRIASYFATLQVSGTRTLEHSGCPWLADASL